MLPLFFAGLMLPASPWFVALVVPGAILARRNLLLATVVFAAALLRIALTPPLPPPLPELDTTITARVVTTPNLTPQNQRAIIDAGGRYLLLYTRPDRDLRAGDVVRFHAKPRAIGGGGANYWMRRGIRQMVSLQYDGEIEILQPGHGVKSLGSAWRTDLLARLRAHLPEDVAAVAIGVVAGQQDLVPKDITEDMRDTGTLHLLATSGFNVLLLAAGLLFVVSHLPVPRWAQIALVLVVLLAYTDAVGGRPPVVRATVMATVFFAAFFFRRSPDGLSSMALAAMACALVEPWTVLDAGYQLSFVVVFGLLLFIPPMFRRIRSWSEARPWPMPLRWAAMAMGSTVATTLVAMAFASPILSASFGTFSLIAPIANLVTAAAVPFIYLGVAIGSVGDLISPAIARGADLLITGPFSASIIRANHALAQVPGASVEGVYLPSWAMVAIYVLLFALSRHSRPDDAGVTPI